MRPPRTPRTPAAAAAAGDRTAAAPSVASGSGRGQCPAEAPPALPLLEAVRARARRQGEAAFHVPGHRRGRGAHWALRELFRPAAAAVEGNGDTPGGFSPSSPSLSPSSPPSSEWEEEESASPHEAYGALGADTTELRGLDLLAAPRAGGPIAEAQALAAATFGARRTWFLVNGSTGGSVRARVGTVSRR